MQNTNTISINMPPFLFLTFLILKLTKVIDWSWWWITAPLWGPFAIIIAFILVVMMFHIVGMFNRKLKRVR